MLLGALAGGLLALRVDNVAPLGLVTAVLVAVVLLATLDPST
jgi:hypothetical protein